MKIQDVRRENLRRWVERNGVPQKEKSYFSQLLGGASFGEKSARRLERDYRMGNEFLDRPLSEPAPALTVVKGGQEQVQTDGEEALINSDEFIELLTLYQQSTTRGREMILDLARSAAKVGRARWVRATRNQSQS